MRHALTVQREEHQKRTCKSYLRHECSTGESNGSFCTSSILRDGFGCHNFPAEHVAKDKTTANTTIHLNMKNSLLIYFCYCNIDLSHKMKITESTKDLPRVNIQPCFTFVLSVHWSYWHLTIRKKSTFKKSNACNFIS